MPRPRTVSDADILAAARTAFLKDGVAASTRAIAAEAGISEAVLFQRFGTKERLFFAAMVPGPAKLDEMFDAEPGRGEVGTNVERCLMKLIDYFREVMPVFVKLVAHPAFDLTEFMKGHDVPAVQIGGKLAEYLAGEAALGRVRGDHVHAAAAVLINAVHNYALMECLGAHPADRAPHAIAGAVDVLWDGLKPERK
jgi:AcrR family transcriptional regulator